MKTKLHSLTYRNLVIALMLAVSSTSVGATEKKKSAKPVVKKSPAKKPTALSEAKSTPKGKANLPLAELKLVEGDEKGNDLKSLKAELMVARAEAQAVKQAQMLLKKHAGTPMEADLHFRLAELYMRRAKTDRFFEVHRESETIVRLAPRIAKESSSRATITKAADTYGLIQKKFPQFPQMDLVIYNHAFARQTLGQERDAEQLYIQLVAKCPNSFLVPDAHLALGEIVFGRNQFSAALAHFDAIRAYPKSRVYPYGLYKAAWTHYNMRDAALGLKKLEEVVAFGKYVAANKIDARLDLRKEALNDMTLFYEDVFSSKDAFAYFKEQAGEQEVGPILLRMGSLYERHSRFNDQRVVLDKFIEELPKSPLLPKVHNDLVVAYDQLRQKDKSIERLAKFSELCQPQETKSVYSECTASLRETSIRLAKKWLRAWKKLPSDTSYADASEKAFGVYLAIPADTEENRQSRFAYAELLFSRNKFREASAQYAQVSKTGAPGELTHNASYAAVLSLEKAVGEKWSNEDEKTFHELAQAYVSKNSKGQYRLDIEYKMGLLAYEKERFLEAAPIFLRLGKEFPMVEKGQKSQDLFLDILNIKKDYRGVRNYAQELLKLNFEPSRELKMRKLYEQAYFLEVQGMEEKQNFKGALAEYQVFAKQNPNSELTEKAMWNSMQLHYKLNDAWNGAKAGEEFAVKFSKSSNATNALLRSAQTFEQMGQLTEAARVLEVLAVRDEKSAARWRELAADFYSMDNNAVNARRLYAELKNQGNQEARTRMLNKLEAVEKQYGTPESHAAMLKTLIDLNIQPQANLAKVAMVEKDLEKGRNEEAFNQARRYLGAGMNANQKARLRLVQAKILEQEFLKASIKARAERVGTVLAIKTEKLQKAQEAFQSAIKYGDPRVSVEAFERLYGCYSSYVKALKEMPTPTGLTKEDEQAFRAELGNLVVPLEEKSVDTLAQAVKFSKSQGFLDGTTARLEAELAKLNQTTIMNLTPNVEQPELVLPIVAGAN
jgi:TolA-binding protein